jgi:flagellar hook-length control protein FliK
LTPLVTGAPLAKDGAPDPVRAPGNFSPVEALGAGAAPGASTATRVTAPSALDPTPARHENPMTQVDSTIKWMIKNQEQSAELQLHPENLGRVQVKLTVDGTEVHARLWASDSAALPILQEHRGALEESLRNQGLHLGSFDLQHGQQGQQTPLPRPEPALPPLTFQAGPAELGQEPPAPMAQVTTGTSRISIVA